MANAIKIDVKIQGLNALKRRLRQLPDTVTEEFRSAMEQIAEVAAARARANAPVLTGKLRASIKGRAKKSGFPSYAVVRVGAKRKRVSYPLILEFSRRDGHLRWLRNPVYSTPIAPALERAARSIEHRWGRGK